MAITLKTAADLASMRIAGRLASEVLDMLTPHVRPGISTEQLDKLAHDHIVHVQGGIPAPLNYARRLGRGFRVPPECFRPGPAHAQARASGWPRY